MMEYVARCIAITDNEGTFAIKNGVLARVTDHGGVSYRRSAGALPDR